MFFNIDFSAIEARVLAARVLEADIAAFENWQAERLYRIRKENAAISYALLESRSPV